jgi:hypothetical protein
MTPPHVLSYYGIDWDDLESLHEDGVLPLEGGQWRFERCRRTGKIPSKHPLAVVGLGGEDVGGGETGDQFRRARGPRGV